MFKMMDFYIVADQGEGPGEGGGGGGVGGDFIFMPNCSQEGK